MQTLNPAKVIKAVIFWSYETATNKTAQRGKLVACKNKNYQIENITKSKVMGTYLLH
jgi:hypothetical protein